MKEENNNNETKQQKFLIPHVEEYSDLGNVNTTVYMIAGATAGLSEHIFMFPIDTIKTRMQTVRFSGEPKMQGIMSGLKSIIKYEGMPKLFRGVSAVIIGAVPSHACYFATYEYVKNKLQNNNNNNNNNDVGVQPLSSAIAGIAATAVHDAIATPMDVVKQRLQLYGSSSAYRGVFHCIKTITLKEGLRAFYVSYPTTLIMNIPFASVHFAAYETFNYLLKYPERNAKKKKKLQQEQNNKNINNNENNNDNNNPFLNIAQIESSASSNSSSKSTYKTWRHIIAGGSAGALAAAVSTPLDVVKTRLQVQGMEGKQYSGIKDAALSIYKEEGYSGFVKGIRPRMLYFFPSTAICWATYEYIKFILSSM